jgi:putative transcriptional regulator
MEPVRMTMAEVMASDDVDRTRIAATTEEDVQRYMREDGEEPDGELPNSDGKQGIYRVSAAHIRSRTGLSQTAFAEALGLPVKTWRNWEQGRTRIEPAAVALLTLLTKDPVGSLETIRQARTAKLRV